MEAKVRSRGRTFSLDESFIDEYRDSPIEWGFRNEAGFSVGETVFIDKYSRKKDARTDSVYPPDPDNMDDFVEGSKERFWEVARRVVEGTFSALLDRYPNLDRDWVNDKAELMYDKMFNMKWLPGGRGLWAMGTPVVDKLGGMPLINCSAVSTRNIDQNFTLPFLYLMDVSMLGVGVGWDTRGEGKVRFTGPSDEVVHYQVEDSREGWVRSLDLTLKSFIGGPQPKFDTSLIRKRGELIKTFGGIAPGPEILEEMHDTLNRLFLHRRDFINSRDITDFFNIIGKAVVSGNVRRTAEIGLARFNDMEFRSLKDYTLPQNQERMEQENGWGGLSNNSLIVTNEDDVNYTEIVESMIQNGEPGLFYIDRVRNVGRTGEYRADDSDLTNPCSEISLFDFETCNLNENFIFNHETLGEFLDTLSISFLYSKIVTLINTHWDQTNEVMHKNRRIGSSISGIVQFLEKHGQYQLQEWLEIGYDHIQQIDQELSEWMDVPTSIKTTTVKPAGSTSLLAGATAGVHWPTASTYIRRLTLDNDSLLLKALHEAGYTTEKKNLTSSVVEIPVKGADTRNQYEVPVREKVELADFFQKYWSDNQVSVTVDFRVDEKEELADALEKASLKSVSCLHIPSPEELLENAPYLQLPYEPISDEKYEEMVAQVSPVDLAELYNEAKDAEGEKYCTGDYCEI